MSHELSFDAVIPSAMLLDKSLEPAAIKLYAITRSLTRQRGFCYATNAYLASLLDAGESTVRVWLVSLVKGGYLEIETNKNGIHWQRRIFLSDKFKKSLRRLENEHPPARNLAPPCSKSSTILEEERKEDNKREREEAEPPPPPFIQGKVKIDQEKYKKLIENFGLSIINSYVDKLNTYAETKPKKFKEYGCHGAVIRTWLSRDEVKPIEKERPKERVLVEKEVKHPDLEWLDNLPYRAKLQAQGKLVMEENFVWFPFIPEAKYYYGEAGFRDKVDSAIRKSLPVPKI